MTNEVSNRNHSSGLKFSFKVEKLPHVNFFVQEVNLPGLNIDAKSVGNPFTTIPVPGEKISFNSLDVTFVIDENYQNWYEIFRWMEGIGFPETRKQYNTVRDNVDENLPTLSKLGNRKEPTDLEKEAALAAKNILQYKWLGNIHSEATLILRTSHNNPNIEVNFEDCWPTSLSDVNFSSTLTEDIPLTARVSLLYTKYTVKAV